MDDLAPLRLDVDRRPERGEQRPGPRPAGRRRRRRRRRGSPSIVDRRPDRPAPAATATVPASHGPAESLDRGEHAGDEQPAVDAGAAGHEHAVEVAAQRREAGLDRRGRRAARRRPSPAPSGGARRAERSTVSIAAGSSATTSEPHRRYPRSVMPSSASWPMNVGVVGGAAGVQVVVRTGRRRRPRLDDPGAGGRRPAVQLGVDDGDATPRRASPTATVAPAIPAPTTTADVVTTGGRSRRAAAAAPGPATSR